MSLITDYYKIDERSSREREADSSGGQKKKTSLISKYYPQKERPKPVKKKTFTEKVTEKVKGGIDVAKQKISDFSFGNFISGAKSALFGGGQKSDPSAQLERTTQLSPEQRGQFITSVSQSKDSLQLRHNQLVAEKSELIRKEEASGIKQSVKNLFYTGVAGMSKELVANDRELKNVEATMEVYDKFLGNVESGKGLIPTILDNLKKDPTTLLPFGSANRAIAKYVPAVQAVKKLDKGEELTREEKISLEAVQADVLIGATKTSLSTQVGEMMADMIPYAMTFGLSGGIEKGTTEAVKKKLGAEVGKKTISNMTKSLVAKSIGIAAQNTTAFAPMIAGETAHYMLPDYQILGDDNGKALIKDIGGEDSFKKAMAKAWTVSYIELVSERVGDLIEPAQAKFFSKINDIIPQAILTKFAFLNKLKTPKALKELAKTFGWNGIVAEVFEEEIAEFAQAPVEEREYLAPFVTKEGSERLLVETLGITALGGIGATINLPSNTKNIKGEPKLTSIDLTDGGILEKAGIEIIPVAEKKTQKIVEAKKTQTIIKTKKTQIVEESITEKKIKAIKDVKTAKSVLKNIRVELESSVAEAEGIAVIAEEQRAGLDTNNVAKLKRIVSLNKKFKEGDIETIRNSKSKDLVNSVIENVQEVHPEMSEQEAFDFAMDLPTKADEKGRTPSIVALEKKEKILRKHLDQLKEKQKELSLKEDAELSSEWQKALSIQEELTKIIKVPSAKLPVGEGKTKVSRLEARVKNKLGNLSEAEIEELGLSTFKQVNKKENIAKASAYVAANPNEALRVIKGEIDPPKGVLVNSVYVALHELGATDTDIATKIASLGATRMGQEISVLSEILKDSPVAMMESIVKTRIEAFEKRTGKKVADKIKSEKKKLKEDLKAPNSRQWDTFLKEILC